MTAVLARLVRLSMVVDKGYRLFDRWRSQLVVRLAGSHALNSYNDFTYGRTEVYRGDSAQFRKELFRWEAEAVDRFFPAAPARVLVGGAGGGREPLALAARGYAVVAFEPSARLAVSMTAAMTGDRNDVRMLVGRYEDLPRLRTTERPPGEVDLMEVEPFAAAVLGWTSFSHLRTDAARVAALRAVASVCRGPILFSFFPAPDGKSEDKFSTGIGFYRRMDEAEVRRTASDAGLSVWHVTMDELDGQWPYAVVSSASPEGVAGDRTGRG